MMNLNYMINIMFILSCFMFSINYKHILLTLISLEFMMINTIYMTYLILMNKFISQFFNMFFISLLISEGIMGLTILVYMIRMTGNDYNNIMNMIKW